jgi:hypothetical protein
MLQYFAATIYRSRHENRFQPLQVDLEFRCKELDIEKLEYYYKCTDRDVLMLEDRCGDLSKNEYKRLDLLLMQRRVLHLEILRRRRDSAGIIFG